MARILQPSGIEEGIAAMNKKIPRTVSPIAQLLPYDKQRKQLNVVIETPRNSRNKYSFDEEHAVFTLKKVLPAGAAFPYDFGYIPGTRGDDGDPLDVLLLMDCPAFPGCVVHSRLIGVIEAEQKEKGQAAIRNDRLVAVAIEAHDYRELKTIKEMSENLLKELEWFFVSYNEAEGREFKLLSVRGPNRAEALLKQGIEAAEKAPTGKD